MDPEQLEYDNSEDYEGQLNNSKNSVCAAIDEEFKRCSQGKLQTKTSENGSNYTVEIQRSKGSEKVSDIMKLQLTNDRELYIKEVYFKVDSWKVYAESERLTLLLQQQSINNNIVDSLKTIVQEICNIINSFEYTAGQGKKIPQKFDKAPTHSLPIPYQGFATCYWSPQGHLITVHNTATSQQKQAKDNKCQYTTQAELNQFVFSQPKKKQSNQIHRHVVEMKEDEENLQPFFQTGINIISEKDEEEYDYLNFQFYQHYFPQFHQQEITKEQKVEKVAYHKDYEFYDLYNNPELIILGEQFKNLSKRVFEQSDKKTVINQNVEISIYDFGSYSFNVDNISQLHEHFTNHLKKNKVNLSPLQVLYQPLEEYFRLFSSSTANYILTSGVTTNQQEYNLKLLKILSDCIYEQQKQSVQGQEMNLIKDFQEYSKKLWNSQYQIYSLYDQISFAIKQSNLKDSKKLLESVHLLKSELNIEMKPEIKNLIGEEISKFNNKQPISQELARGKQIVSTYDNFEKRYGETTIQINWMQLNSFPLIISDKVEFNLNVLKNALRAQSPLNFCIYKKLKSASFQVRSFRDQLNQHINISIGYLVKDQYIIKQDPKTYCSVCQMDVENSGLFCSQCSHGGHYEHVMNWKQRCPICGCDCRKQ